MWFIGVEVEQETSAPPPKKNPGSALVIGCFERKTGCLNGKKYTPKEKGNLFSNRL